MRWIPLLFLPLGCGSSKAPDTFDVFYGELHKKLCALAKGDCAYLAEDLSCDGTPPVPACTGYEPALGQACLDAAITCDAEGLTSETRACEEVCETGGPSVFGLRAPEACMQMLLCDQAFAEALDLTPSFDGLADPNYGNGGACYEGDPDACAAACESAVDGFRTALASAVSAGTLPFVPAACL